MKSINLPLLLICGFTQLPAFSQGAVTSSSPVSTFSPVSAVSPVGGSGGGITSVGSASPIRPLRSYYPRQVIQNPSNPWLPPNLGQVNTNLSPVGSISPTGTLTQPTSVLNTPGSIQSPGFPTVPTYNIGTNTPTTQSVVVGGGSIQTSIANPANPGAQGSASITNNGSVSRTNPTNPNFP